MLKKSKVLYLTRLIWKARNRDKMITINIEGEEGAGKSVLAMYVLREIYGSWEQVFRHWFFFSLDALEYVKNYIESKPGTETFHKRIPVIVMDDAGLDLGGMGWWEGAKAEFGEAYNIFRTGLHAVIMTDVEGDELLKVLRRKVRVLVMVEDLDEDNVKELPEAVRQRLSVEEIRQGKWSIAKYYRVRKVVTGWGRKRVYKKLHSEIFPRHAPTEIYMKYWELRRAATLEKMQGLLARAHSKLAEAAEEIARHQRIKELLRTYNASNRDQLIVEMYKVGTKISAISRLLGVSRDTVYRTLRKYGMM